MRVRPERGQGRLDDGVCRGGVGPVEAAVDHGPALDGAEAGRGVGPQVDTVGVGAPTRADRIGQVGHGVGRGGAGEQGGGAHGAGAQDQGRCAHGQGAHHVAGGVQDLHVEFPAPVGQAPHSADVVQGPHIDQPCGLGLCEVGDVHGVLAAVVDAQRAVAVGVGGPHLAAQFGQGEVPVDGHGDLAQGQTRVTDALGEHPGGGVLGCGHQFVGSLGQPQHPGHAGEVLAVHLAPVDRGGEPVVEQLFGGL